MCQNSMRKEHGIPGHLGTRMLWGCSSARAEWSSRFAAAWWGSTAGGVWSGAWGDRDGCWKEEPFCRALSGCSTASLLGEWRSWQEWGIGKLGLSGTVVPITNVTGLVPQCSSLLTALAHPGGSEGTERTHAGEREVTEGLSCLEFCLEHPCLLLDI